MAGAQTPYKRGLNSATETNKAFPSFTRRELDHLYKNMALVDPFAAFEEPAFRVQPLETMAAKGWTTFATFAFSLTYQPGQNDDALLLKPSSSQSWARRWRFTLPNCADCSSKHTLLG
eukprot:1797380-Amphidinium_carterae.2